MLKNSFLLAFPVLSFGQSWVPFDQSLPCLFNPISLVEAGSVLDFQIFNSRNSTCKATLNFADPTFLPITLTVKPANCAGDQFASFSIPFNAPNGMIAVQWQCSGQQTLSCALLNITHGTGNSEKFQLEQEKAQAHVTCRNMSSLFQSTMPLPTTSCT